MAIPSSGPLALTAIQTEFGGTNPISLSEYYAGGGLVPAGTSGTNGPVPSSGQISVSNFYGTSNIISYTVPITGDTANYDAYANRGPSYVAGISNITYSISPGVVVYSNNSNPAFTVSSSFAAGDVVTIVNNGTILGRGGTGGNGGNAINFANATSGGGGSTGLSVSRPITLNNINRISGGGGGGGGGAGFREGGSPLFGGGGGGGGIGNGPGGSGGPAANYPGAGGGTGTTTAAGGGGYGGNGQNLFLRGGAGGSYAATGTTGERAPYPPPYENWEYTEVGSGGSGGPAISGNSYITYTNTGTRNGPIT